jgi:hypothetical protein
MAKKPVKFKRYEEGGDVEESKAKQRGLEMSNKEAPVGFFERFRMGNIDDPSSEAYKRFGAGRGRSEAPAKKEEPAPAMEPTPVARPSMKPRPIERALSDDMYSDTGSKTGFGSAGTKYDVAASSSRPSDAIDLPSLPAMTKFPETKNKPSTPKPTASKPIASAPTREVGESVSVNEPFIAPKKLRQETMNERAESFIAKRAARKAEEAAKNTKLRGQDRILTNIKKNTGENKFMGSTGLKSGGSVSSASRRADGIASKGKTKGKMITMKNGGKC